jgi:hypothetical protein
MIYTPMTSYKSLTINSVTLLCLLVYLFIVKFTMLRVLPISEHSTVLINSTSCWIMFIGLVSVIFCDNSNEKSLFP